MIGQFTEKEIEHIKSTMAVFTQTTNLSCYLINEKGLEIYQEGNRAHYCKAVTSIAQVEDVCTNAHHHFSRQSKELAEAYIAYCPAGMVHYSVAIQIGDVHKGAIIAGPVHMSEPDDYEMEQFLDRFDIDHPTKNKLKRSYHQVKFVSPTTARYQLQLLNLLVKEIVGDTQTSLKKQKAIYDEQRKINEAVQELKDIESMATVTGGSYPIQLEKELSGAIIKGDESSAKAILNEILGFVFFKYMGDNKKIIGKSIELIVVMSRAAIEGGANFEAVEKITEDIYTEAIISQEIETICTWLIDVLEALILVVFPINAEKVEHHGILRKAIVYMNQNVFNDMTLDDVAKEVSLSPTYFSRFFKNEMQMTYIEYLTKIRIEESKKYLVDSKESISDIAVRLNFTDQSYFSKVFKKYEGMTPGKYRRMY